MAIRPDINQRDLSILENVWRDLAKGINTAIPGTIVTYDQATRRARVRPSLRRRDENGTVSDRPDVSDVPVLWPGGDGVTAHGSLQENDQVLLVYSQRGYRAFLEGHTPAAQDTDGLMSPAHPVAVPWFGTATALTPPRGGFGRGFVLQTDDGALAVRIDRGGSVVDLVNGQNVRVRASETEIRAEVSSDTHITAVAGTITLTVGGVAVATFTAGGSAFQGAQFEHLGKHVGNLHTHSGVTTGPGVSGPPV